MSGEIRPRFSPQIDVSDVVDMLVNMFGEVMDRDVIAAVVVSYGGDITQATEALLKLSEDSQALKPVEPHIPLHPTMLQQPWPQPNSPNCSYASVSKQPAVPSKNYSVNSSKKHKSLIGHPSVWTNQLKNIVTYHNKGYRTLIIMRGASGSGKTYLSNAIVEITVGTDRQKHVFSADDYFQTDSGYAFNPSLLEVAHRCAKTRAYKALQEGISPVIIDNTNTQLWEMEPYVCEGVKQGYIIELVEPTTAWVRDAYLLAARNTHGVTLQKVQNMLDRYERNLTGDIVIKRLGLHYPTDKTPPVLRSFPPIEPVIEKQEEKVNVIITHDLVETEAHNATPYNITKETTSTLTNKTSNCNFDEIKTENTENPNLNQSEDANEITEHPPSEVNTAKELTMQDQISKNISELKVCNELSSTKESISPDKELKVLEEWDANETWEESVETDKKNQSVSPKHQRIPKRDNPPILNPSKVESNKPQREMNDWLSFTYYLPPWNPDHPSSIKSICKKKITQNEGTNTEAGDTNLLTTMYRVIDTQSRDINKYHLPESEKTIPDVRMLDKSTMTQEPNIFNVRNYRCKNEEKHFQAIRSLFKKIARSDLRDIFDYCQGDPNWTVSCILDSVSTNEIQCHDEEVSDCEDIEDEPCDCVSKYQIIPYVDHTEEDKVEPSVEETESKNEVTLSSRKKQRRSKSQRTISETRMQLQKQLEESVSISGAHYSPHTLKIRNDRRGRGSLDDISALSFNKNVETKDISATDKSPEDAFLNDLVSENTSEKHESVNEEYAMSDSDIEMCDEIEENVKRDLKSDEKTVYVGYEFIKNIDKLFNKESVQYPQEIMPLINMPMSLLKEIYALWVESFTHQMTTQQEWSDILLKEDEEFARQLAAKEEEMAREGREPEVPDFKEIMDMDLALSLYQKETADWRNKESNDLASIMTRDKLYNLFPNMSKDVLSEMLMAHDNNFQTTVEVLLMSTGQGDILQQKNGLNKFIMDGEMARQNRILEEQKQVNQIDVNEDKAAEKWPLQTVVPDGEEEFTLAMVFKFREQAQKHLKWRNHYLQKAQNSLREESTGIAHYYSGVATYHKKQFEYSNHLAATALIQVHSLTTENTTLDLHYMFVSEAVEAMDLFIDHHIQVVRSSPHGRREHVFIVTGRGIHSNGKPKIKPAAIKRLKHRGFDIVELNPGLLAIELRSSSKLTSELKKKETQNK